MQYACPFFIPLSQRVSVVWGVSNEQMVFFEYLKTLVQCSSEKSVLLYTLSRWKNRDVRSHQVYFTGNCSSFAAENLHLKKEKR